MNTGPSTPPPYNGKGAWSPTEQIAWQKQRIATLEAELRQAREDADEYKRLWLEGEDY
jgi:hypothetical protein